MTSSAHAVALVPASAATGPRVYELDPLQDSRWEAIVRIHPRASLFHSANWLRALKTAYGYDPVVFTSSAPGAALTDGLVFCRIKSWLTGRRLVSVPFSDHCEPLIGSDAELDGLLATARAEVDGGGWGYIEIRPVSSRPDARTGLAVSNTYRLHRLPLQDSAEALFDSFHKSCIQRKIRRAEREGLRYEEGNSERLLQKFYKLMVLTRERLFLPPQPKYWFRALMAAFGADLKIRVASKNGAPVASILTIAHGSSMFYKYGASEARANRFGGMPLLFWNTIQDAKGKELAELDLGRSDPSSPGLISFKEHWGAVGTEVNYWRYPNRNAATPSSWQTSVMRKMIPLTPNFVLPAVGSVLYKHIG